MSITPNGYQLVLGRLPGTAASSTIDTSSFPTGSASEKNPKSQLLEFFQKKQETPHFTTTPLSKPPANPSFKCVLVCPAVSNPYGSERVVPETAFEGNGRSKKLAEQSACVQALELYRSKRLIGNLKMMQNNSSPVPSAMPETSQMYTVAPGSIQQPGQASEVYMQPGLLTGAIPMQPVLANGGMAVQPTATAMMATQSAYTAYSGEPVLPSFSRPMTSESDNPGSGLPIDSEADEEENEYTLDNSDYSTRRAEILASSNIHDVQDIAVEALNEILELRQELFNAKMAIKDRIRKARKIQRIAYELTQE